MCFGEQEQSKKQTDFTANPAVAGAANENLSFAQGLQSKGATPYGGQMVAPISGQQQNSFGMADSIGDSPTWGTAQGYINNSATAGPGSVDASTIASKMDPYMSKYVQDSLAPQLEQQKQQFDTQNRGANANATMSGAFGNDSQDALYRSNLTNEQNIARTGLIGNAYNTAFNTAIGAGAQDVSNNLNAQTTNQGLREQALQRGMQGATGLEQLQQGREGATSLVNQMGQQQTAQAQAKNNADYQEFLRQQQQPYLATELLNQTIGAGSQAMPASQTATTSAPDNSGFQVAGSLFGSAAKALPFLADGGPLGAGQPAVVGERGPELAVPSGVTLGVAPPQLPTMPALPSISMMPAPAQAGQQQPQQAQGPAPVSNAPLAQFWSGMTNNGKSTPSLSFGGGGSGGAMGKGPMDAGNLDGFDASIGAGSMDPTMMGFAGGGMPPVGQPSVVGEHGPEVIVPNQPVTVVPNEQLRGANSNRKPKKAKKHHTTDPLAEQMGLAA